MRDDRKMKIFPSIFEVLFVMFLLMSAYEYIKQLFLNGLSVMQWQIVTVIYAGVMASLVSYFVLQRHKSLNKELLLELKILKKMEDELKEKVNELVKFKELILWWEKKVGDLQQDMDMIKAKMEK